MLKTNSLLRQTQQKLSSRRRIRWNSFGSLASICCHDDGRTSHSGPSCNLAPRSGQQQHLFSTEIKPSQSDQEQKRSTLLDPYEQALAELPDGAQLHLDFFGEPVTFFGVSSSSSSSSGDNNSITTAVASLDGFVIGVASKGKSFTGGGEEEGIFVQGAHSAALAWSELIRHAALWNTPTRPGRSAPMLTYVAVAPMLVQTGVGYMKYVDHLLSKVESGVERLPPIQLSALAHKAAFQKDDEHLNPRERTHLQVLDCLLRHDHR